MPALPPTPARSARFAEFYRAVTVSFLANLVLLVFVLAAGPAGDAVTLIGLLINLGAVVTSWVGRHDARAGGLIVGFLLCLGLFILWLYYAFSHLQFF